MWFVCGPTFKDTMNYVYVYIIVEKEMAAHSSILAWRIPWTEEPGRQQFMGSQRVKHDWTTEHIGYCKNSIC